MEFLAPLYLRQPLWLSALAFPLIWYVVQHLWQHKRQTDYAEARFWPWVKQNHSRFAKPAWLISGAWLMLVLALAGPRWEITSHTDRDREAVDTLVLLDLSRSMSAQDVTPNRLGFAQNLLESMSQRLQVQDRLGLVAYGVQAHWASPLSWDKALFNRALYLLDNHQLPLDGTQLDQALIFALDQLKHPSVVLLVTDSAQANPERLSAAIQQLKASSHHLIILGVGHNQTLLMPDSSHPSGWFHYENQPISVPLQRESLQRLAQQLDGRYFDARGDANFLQQLLTQIEAQATPRQSEHSTTEYRDLAWPLMALALLLLMLNFSTGKLKKPHHTPLSLILLAAALSLIQTPESWAQTEHDAYQAFVQQDFARAEALYQDWYKLTLNPDEGYRALLGAGNSAYRQTAYSRAVFWYRQALLQAENDQQRAQSLYNLANSQAQLEFWPQAIAAYQDVMRYDPSHQNAKHNLALVQAQLDALLAAPIERADEQASTRSRQDLESAFRGGQSTGGSGDGDPNDWGESQQDAEGQHQAEFEWQNRLIDTAQNEILNQTWQLNAATQEHFDQQRRQRRIENLNLQLEQLDDDQQGLLTHLFERESGFQARQQQTHQVEGIQPW